MSLPTAWSGQRLGPWERTADLWAIFSGSPLSASDWQTRRRRDGDADVGHGGCAQCVVNARL